MIQAANLDDQFESALANLGVLVHAPLAGKLSDFFVVTADHHFERPLGELLTRLNHQGFLDEEAQSAHDRFVMQL